MRLGDPPGGCDFGVQAEPDPRSADDAATVVLPARKQVASRPVAGAAYGRRDPGCARGWGLDQAAQTPQRARWRPVAGDHAACCGRAPVAARARRRALGPSPDRGFRSARGREAAKGRSPAGGRRRAQGWILTVGDGRAGSRPPYAGSANSGRCPAGRRRPGGRWCASAGAFLNRSCLPRLAGDLRACRGRLDVDAPGPGLARRVCARGSGVVGLLESVDPLLVPYGAS